jgi:hypothetical protein
VIADLKPYADYKESGVSWLGKVPAHWQIVRSKRLFTARQELARPDDVQLSATQAYGVIAQSLYEERTGYRVVKNAMANTPHTASIAFDQALAKAAQILLTDDTAFYRQFVENGAFRRSVRDMVLHITSAPSQQPPAH